MGWKMRRKVWRAYTGRAGITEQQKRRPKDTARVHLRDPFYRRTSRQAVKPLLTTQTLPRLWKGAHNGKERYLPTCVKLDSGLSGVDDCSDLKHGISIYSMLIVQGLM